MIAGGSD